LLEDLGQATGTMISDKFGGHKTAGGRGSAAAAARGLSDAFHTIQTVCPRLELNQVVTDRSREIYRLSYEHGLVKSKNGDAIVAASIFLGARDRQVVLSITELLREFPAMKKREFSKAKATLKDKLNIQEDVAAPSEFVGLIRSRLNLPQEVESLARKLAENVSQHSVCSGMQPSAVAAACVIIVGDLLAHSISFADLSNVTTAVETTIQGACDKIKIQEALVMPKELLERASAMLPPL